MFFMTESGNPFDYMGNMWTVLIVVLGVCFLLLVLAKPLHRYWTDRKTRQIIDESGGPAPAVEPRSKEDEPTADEDETKD
jgi:hypothetical protein